MGSRSFSIRHRIRIFRGPRPGKNLRCQAGARRYVANMDWQEAMALLIVAATAAAFAWARFRPRKFSLQRDTHCGCSSSGADRSAPSVVFHARKGERPRFTVKMK